MTLTVIVSLLAATCFGVASVLQHHGALRARRRAPLHPGLMVELVGKPSWLAGVVAQATGVTLHLVAVNLGRLSVVQPLLTIGLVVALVLQRMAGRRVSQPAMLAAGLVVVGLALFLAVMPPEQPGAPADAEAWTPGLALVGLVLAGTLGGGLLMRGTTRCVCLGASAGVLMATSAALGKAWGAVLHAEGILGLATSWQLWAALACGAGGTMLSQAAFQAGPLGGSLAAMMAIDPVIGVGLGVVVYGEPFATEETLGARCLGLALTLVGVWLLAMAQRGSDTSGARANRAGLGTG
ncbi:DMT family transporter [Pseudonocardia acaciae]|uniref:DMT family transporter n=1 Tax=Pseudonocardia acaciae TaxID=551276 RepID=UPI000686B19F|nr:DMT family transporter [Pseudonocardia acaciae]